MDAFMSALIKMSLRGIVIILVFLLVRLLLKKLQIDHKYILGLWAMAFLYFVFPWKLSLSVGFWNNVHMPEEVRMITEPQSVADERYGEVYNTANIVIPAGITDNTMADAPAVIGKDTVGTAAAIPVEPAGQNIAGINGIKENSSGKFEIESLIELIWLAGLSSLFGHMLYSYFALKRKLRLSVLFEDNIWWAENIDIPMVFGLIHSQIYLPISMEFENLSYVIAHEKMHVKRKDGLIKMFAYVVCLIHWFNPFIWIAYFLFGSDMEKACDEEVIRTMSKEKRKEYAYALLHIATGNGSRKKRVFVAPICFDEGNVKSRIRNIMKYRYTIPGIGAAVVIVILALSAMFLTEAKGSNADDPLLVQSDDMPVMETLEINGTTFYLVFNEEQLRVIGTGEYGMDLNYMQQADIQLSTNEWIPIGTWKHPFTGTYNGNGYEIIGLTMTDPDAKIIGLFGVARDNAQIYNTTLRDCDIMSAGKNAANKSAGAIVAIAYGGRAYDNAVVFTNDNVQTDKGESATDTENAMSIIHESADILNYENGQPYIHDILTNNTDRTIIETEYCIGLQSKRCTAKIIREFP